MKPSISALDTCIYALIGPFTVLHGMPNYFRGIDNYFGVENFIVPLGHVVGMGFMNLGAALAIWCAWLMWRTQRGSISPMKRPQCLVATGPYRVVRHPMMWSINFVLLGEVLTWGSWSVLAWAIIWLRFSVVYIREYEEPYLQGIFGSAYIEYCRTTPRWWPNIFRRINDSASKHSATDDCCKWARKEANQ